MSVEIGVLLGQRGGTQSFEAGRVRPAPTRSITPGRDRPLPP